MRAILLALVVVAGCGGRATTQVAYSPTTQSSSSQSSQLRGSGLTPQDAVQACHAVTPRTDYAYVASYQCPDGSVPLGGDLARGQAARVGNVGEGPDGHILDLYEIPCASPVRVYVDMYHCPEGVDAEPDPNHLTRPQLVSIAQLIHALAQQVDGERAFQLRRELMQWIIQTPQLTVSMCPNIYALLPSDDPNGYGPNLMLALAGAVIDDGRDPVDGAAVMTAAFLDLLVYYQAVISAHGPAQHDPQMDALLASAQDGSLPSRIAFIASGCDLSTMGVHFY